MAAVLHTMASRIRLTGFWRRIHASSVPVIMFHGVIPSADTSPFNASGKMVSPEKLRSFLAKIARIFRVVSMDEFVACIRNGERADNIMVLTFDDGYRNVYRHAYPVLKDMGLPFTVFVSTGFVDTDRVMPSDVLNYAMATTAAAVLPKGVLPRDVDIGTPEAKATALELLKNALKTAGADRKAGHIDRICEALRVRRDGPEWDDARFLTSAEMREMTASGVSFGGHTVTHPILSSETPDRVRAEVRECKHALEAITGTRIDVFAYPNGGRGDFSEAVKNEVRQAGYAASFSTIHGLYRPGDDPFEIRRVGLDNRWSYEEFETRASGILKAFRR
jgi:peptidoglycan/xylan/chitin deacetylase (PgdA/CDA1 family)